MTNSEWRGLEPDLETILATEPNPVQRIASGEVPAIVVRGAFPAEECASLVRYLVEQELIFDSGDPRIEQQAIAPQRVDRWTKNEINRSDTPRRRIDVGTSLGNYGDDKEDFFRKSAETHQLFNRLFADRPNPIRCLYDHLQQLVPGKRVLTAREPDGREYGPAIFRTHYGGYTYPPHFDSVRHREQRTEYAVYKYAHQLAGVLCLQNATLEGMSAQGILHRQFWNPEVDPYLNAGRFAEFAAERNVQQAQIDLEPGDLYFFNTGLIHEVPGVPGDHPRIVLAVFIGYSEDDDEVMVWS